MRAALSPRAGLAVVEDNGCWYSLHYSDMSQLIPRMTETLPLLLRGVTEVEWLVADSLDTVKQMLADAVDCIEAIDLVLYLLDSQLTTRTRRLAATEFEELCAYPEVLRAIECVFLSHPLPESADLKGAIEACKEVRAYKAQFWLNQLRLLQDRVRDTVLGWRIHTRHLSTDGFEALHNLFVKNGIFRRFVLCRNLTSLKRSRDITRVELLGCDSSSIHVFEDWCYQLAEQLLCEGPDLTCDEYGEYILNDESQEQLGPFVGR